MLHFWSSSLRKLLGKTVKDGLNILSKNNINFLKTFPSYFPFINLLYFYFLLKNFSQNPTIYCNGFWLKRVAIIDKMHNKTFFCWLHLKKIPCCTITHSQLNILSIEVWMNSEFWQAKGVFFPASLMMCLCLQQWRTYFSICKNESKQSLKL